MSKNFFIEIEEIQNKIDKQIKQKGDDCNGRC
jgi:hypothetical protein